MSPAVHAIVIIMLQGLTTDKQLLQQELDTATAAATIPKPECA